MIFSTTVISITTTSKYRKDYVYHLVPGISDTALIPSIAEGETVKIFSELFEEGI